MTRLSTAQVYAYAKQAGFGPASAVIMTAVVAAESGNRTDAIGDVNLTEPGEKSVGLAQINYRPRRDRGNAVRDPQANLDPALNLQHAFTISGGGKRFTPWSTFTSGAYLKHLGAARTAAGQPAAALPSSIDSSGAAQQVGLTGSLVDPTGIGGWLWDHTVGGAVSDAQKGVVSAVYKGAITLAVFGGGIFLVVTGLRETVAPALDKAKGQAAQGAQVAAMAAV